MEQQLTAILSIPHEAGYFFPDRHYKYFGHTQLYRLMIEKLEACDRINEIWINSDSPDIARNYAGSKVKVINVYKVEPQEAEMELTSDKATAAILDHVQGEHFLQLGPIFPFLKPATLESAIDKYYEEVLDPESDKYDSVFTIRVLNRRTFDTDTDQMREDRPNTFVEDGILHLFNRTAFNANGKRKAGKRPFAWAVDEIENLAVDSEENYLIAGYIQDNKHRFPRFFGR